jgi:hypothetical protein
MIIKNIKLPGLDWLNALIMQHRDNYFVLYLHRYKETGLTR